MNIHLLLSMTLLIVMSSATPQQGKFTRTVTIGINEIEPFVKTLYKDSTIKISISSKHCTPANAALKIKWTARSSSCYGEYTVLTKGDRDRLYTYLNEPYHGITEGSSPSSGVYQTNIDDNEEFKCDATMVLSDFSDRHWSHYPIPVHEIKNTTTVAPGNRKKREEVIDEPPPAGDDTEDTADKKKKEVDPTPTPKKTTETIMKAPGKHVVTTVKVEAPFLLVVEIIGLAPDNTTSGTVEITVEMKTPKGYLSAHEYPLLTFYMIMCILYSFYAVAWLVMSACNFRDLLRVQFWIGGVILLGMIEKAVFYSEYLSVNSTGESVVGAAKFAEVVSAMKRALARMLVIIVSLGFGIVKPRLGPMLHRVIGIGMLYFILAVIEALVRTDSASHDPTSGNLLFAEIPLAVLDSIICWWIFMSLMQTMKTLRLRRNVIKLSLYRHFSNTIIFCVIASLIMIFYSARYKNECITDWQEVWIDDAFWHILFSVILLVIMILWRPNINNQRYAFSPLIDGEEDDEEEAAEPMLGGSGAQETVKMRGLKNAADPIHNPNQKAEDDLKWIEENIPQTVADAALPAIMDSDEEVMTTKYEMSKME